MPCNHCNAADNQAAVVKPSPPPPPTAVVKHPPSPPPLPPSAPSPADEGGGGGRWLLWVVLLGALGGISLELSSRLDAGTGGLFPVCSPQLLAGMLGIWFCVRAQRAVGGVQSKLQKKENQHRRKEREVTTAAGHPSIRKSSSSSKEPEPASARSVAPKPQSPSPALVAKAKTRGQQLMKDWSGTGGVATALRRFLSEPTSEPSEPTATSAAPQPELSEPAPEPSPMTPRHLCRPGLGFLALILAIKHIIWRGNMGREAERPSVRSSVRSAAECSICMESYSAAGGVVPRLLVTCGHDFCEGCLDKILSPLRLRNGRKQLECPMCRTVCSVRGGRAAALPIVYSLHEA